MYTKTTSCLYNVCFLEKFKSFETLFEVSKFNLSFFRIILNSLNFCVLVKSAAKCNLNICMIKVCKKGCIKINEISVFTRVKFYVL